MSFRFDSNYLWFLDAFPIPLVSPFNQTVTEGGSTVFTCEANPQSSDSSHLASFQWFQHNSNTSFEFYIENSIGSGSVLEINNVTSDFSGRLFCCALYLTGQGSTFSAKVIRFVYSTHDHIDHLIRWKERIKKIVILWIYIMPKNANLSNRLLL